jgi:DNA invertase Pin-like site-specific DNA recombinase
VKKVAIYARVSTSDQNTESQLMELRSYAQRRDYEIYREYVDHVTGVVSKRRAGQGAEYKRLISDAKMRRFDIVLVWKFDRFARSLQALLEGLKLFEHLGIGFISATQEIDTTSATGILFFHIVGAFAEFERSMIVERVKAGIANARRKGVQLGRKRASSTIEEQRILDLHERGKSIAQISDEIGRSRSGVWLVLQRFNNLASSEAGASTEVDSVRPGGVISK